MAQFPVIPDEWFPIANSSQFLSPAASTALTVPGILAGQPAKGAVILAELVAIGDPSFIRLDGGVVSNVAGIPMFATDYRVIYGTKALAAVRIIRTTAASVIAVSYFYFRMTP